MNMINPQSDLALTPKGNAYAATYALRPAGCPDGVNPVTWRRAVEARAETLLDMVAALMASLDQMDGDAEAEIDTDDEGVDEDGGDLNDTHHSDLDEGELDTADHELSLGWGDSMCQGLGIMTAGRGDLEDTSSEWAAP